MSCRTVSQWTRCDAIDCLSHSLIVNKTEHIRLPARFISSAAWRFAGASMHGSHRMIVMRYYIQLLSLILSLYLTGRHTLSRTHSPIRSLTLHTHTQTHELRQTDRQTQRDKRESLHTHTKAHTHWENRQTDTERQKEKYVRTVWNWYTRACARFMYVYMYPYALLVHKIFTNSLWNAILVCENIWSRLLSCSGGKDSGRQCYIWRTRRHLALQERIQWVVCSEFWFLYLLSRNRYSEFLASFFFPARYLAPQEWKQWVYSEF